jgi:hypothetical protein
MPLSAPSSPPRSASRRTAGTAAGTSNTFFITGGGAEAGLVDPETAAVEDMAANVMDQVSCGNKHTNTDERLFELYVHLNICGRFWNRWAWTPTTPCLKSRPLSWAA